MSTVTVLLLLLAYPGYWVLRLPALGAKPIDVMQTRVWLALALASSIAVIPGSFGDLGFLFVPISVLLVALVYAATHLAVAQAMSRRDERVGAGAFMGFLVPPTVVGAVVLSVTLQQAAQASAMGLRGVASMNSPAIMTFIVIAVTPSFVASGHIAWVRRRSAT